MVVIRYVLFIFFVFMTSTIAAFVNLVWYQALLVSALTFLGLCWLTMFLIRLKLRQAKSRFLQIFDIKSQVLHGASVDVHSVKPARLTRQQQEECFGEEGLQDLGEVSWYQIEFTLFPRPATGPMTHWDADDLTLIPSSMTVPTEGSGPEPEIEVVPCQIQVVEDGEAHDTEGSKFTGPQRLRVTVGLPHGIQHWKFRYYTETFGQIRLPVSIA